MGLGLRVLLVAIVMSTLWAGCSGQRIKVLLTGQIHESANTLQDWFSSEPLVDYHPVPSKDPWGLLGGDQAMSRFIRLYFPRTYDGLKEFDFLLLNSPVTYLFTSQQLVWMFDAIREGAGGLNTASIMSSVPEIHGSWVASVLQEAFPNDAPAVMANYGGATSLIKTFRIRVNEDFPHPVLTPFVPLGIEGFVGEDSRFIIMREGASPIAWQEGNFPGETDVPFLVAWQYEEGITMTLGDYYGATFWSSYRGTASDNIYALDILMNMILYGTKREVPTEVEVFHRVRSTFLEFRNRMSMLLSLKGFVERFGANTKQIEDAMGGLEAMAKEASDHYLALDFEACEETMNMAFGQFSDAEEVAMKLKDSALFWVYVIEWLVTTSALLVSSFALWSLMVRRRLYRVVRTTRLA
jgi:hypothetical protein